MARSKIELDSRLEATLKDASLKLTGFLKRAFMAKATRDYFDGSARKAKDLYGMVQKSCGTRLN